MRQFLSVILISLWAMSWARCTAERCGVLIGTSMECCISQHEDGHSDHVPGDEQEKSGCMICEALDALIMPSQLIITAAALIFLALLHAPAFAQLLLTQPPAWTSAWRAPPDPYPSYSKVLLTRACPVRGPAFA